MRASCAPLHLLLLLVSVRDGSSAPHASLDPSQSGALGEEVVGQKDSEVCWFEGREYAAGAVVPTPEKCLTCRCGERGGAPLCRLQVCPELPVPPPRGCVLVHRRGECCQRLVCEPPMDNYPDTESRNSLTKITSENVDIASDNGCVVNGTRYAEGSATGSSSLCEYCYCVRGGQRCVRPQCEMPLQGCTPRYRALACCPVSYDCSGSNSTGVASTTSTTTLPPRASGCLVDGARHTEGAQVRALAGNCERCYCLRGAVRCVTLECAPPLMGCSPVFAPGRCCPVQYNCSKIMTEPFYRERQDSDITILLQMAEGERGSSAELRRHREMTENTTTNTTEVSAKENSESGAGVEEEEDAVEKPAEQQHETVMDTTSADEADSDTTTSAPKKQTESAITDQVNEQEAIEARTEDSEDTTVEDTTLIAETTESPPSTEDGGITTDEVPVTDSETTVLQEKTEEVTTVMASSSIEPITVPPRPQVIEDRVDNLAELLDLLLDDSTVAPKEVPTTVTSTTSTTTTTTTTTTTPAPTTLPPSIPTTLSPLIEALLHAKNKEEITENEYGTALPPSLPNITMIPFLPEDAVVDKKKDSYTSTESGIHFKGAVQSQGFSPPAAFVGGFVPRQPPLLDEAPLFYPTSPQPDSGDILTAPQASLPPIISLTTPSPEIGIDSITVESTITLANPAATRDVPLTSHIRVAAGHRACITPDGREVAHGDLLASPGPCEVCRCDRGTVHCHEETACSEKTMVQDRVDMESERFTTPSPGGSLHGPSLANLVPPENKVAEDEGDFSLDSVFDFLFMHGESTVAPPPPPPPSPMPVTAVETRARPTRPPPQDPPPPPLPASVAGILKLAGCNIYGRMYRVGRIISELSGPCRECRCTELGVQCRPLLC